MNCIYCGRPIEEHGAGRETDECVTRALGRKYPYYEEIYCEGPGYNVYENTLWRSSCSRADAMGVWEALPKERRLHEYKEGAVVFCGGHSYGASSDYADGIIAEAADWKLAICHAILMLKAGKFEVGG